MKLSDIARVTVKKDSEIYKNMLGCDLISRLQQKEVKAEVDYKKIKKYKSKKRKPKKPERRIEK